ncbi:MAG: M48 family metalloprotease [Acidobacteria bacterium]|nr:M48 family metalloprotease [Acidobacteriota bacterium]MYA46761.1 M48 family metalloprotease [Acidobacteriota bacterium]MYI37670.1 M48 family metalloprotease [Acidobacteriota bacterium]
MAPIPLAVLAGLAASFLLAPAAPARAQAASADPPLTAERVIAAAFQTESELIARMRELQPMVEVYIQDVSADTGAGQRPLVDTYFLGRFGWDGGPELELLVDEDRGRNGRKTRITYLPDGFASMAAPDWEGMSAARYDFTFVRREFLGEARTFVFDVAPRDGPNDGFSGRVWVEDREFHIVRFNGINRRTRGNWFRRRFTFRVDGWRVNVSPGVWVPAYVYCEEPFLRSQVRFWGYEPEVTDLSDEFTSIEIPDPAIQGNAGQPNQLPPVQSQRRWEEEAEANVLERLERARLLAPAGDVEAVLNTVLNNLIVTNDIVLSHPVQARVLLTSPLESFTLGRTIVLSRGLIDVLPNEASLAMMLAHELAHVVLGHKTIDTRFAYADRLMLSDPEFLGQLGFGRGAEIDNAADTLAIEVLENSPYAERLPEAGLFLRIVTLRASSLPNLILPHVGDVIIDGENNVRMKELMLRSPELRTDDLAQVPALPLGARLYVDPWSGRLELLQTASMSPGSIREKAPLEVTPLTPFLTYADDQAAR